jgi:hypothetical protein
VQHEGCRSARAVQRHDARRAEVSRTPLPKVYELPADKSIEDECKRRWPDAWESMLAIALWMNDPWSDVTRRPAERQKEAPRGVGAAAPRCLPQAVPQVSACGEGQGLLGRCAWGDASVPGAGPTFAVRAHGRRGGSGVTAAYHHCPKALGAPEHAGAQNKTRRQVACPLVHSCQTAERSLRDPSSARFSMCPFQEFVICLASIRRPFHQISCPYDRPGRFIATHSLCMFMHMH